LSTTQINSAIIVSFGVFALLGALLSRYPLAGLALIGSLVIFTLAVFLVRKLAQIELWQVLVLVALTGYIVLNYGFANFAIHVGGIPIIVGHSLMLGALALAASRRWRFFVKALSDPSMVCILILIGMAVFRLCFDVPQFGFVAMRDASMFTDGIFLPLGLVWAMEKRNSSLLLKWLTGLFLLNFIYACTFPFAKELEAWSPESGIFQKVSILGHYGTNATFLLAGALFYILLAQYSVRRSRFVLVSFAVLQLLGLAMLQERAQYLSLLVCLFILALLGQIRKCTELLISTSLALTALLLLTSVLGIGLSGRIGPMTLAFVRAHASSLLGQRYAPEEGSINDRLDWYGQVWEELRSPTTLLVGKGFGKPLIEFYTDEGVVVRQPHNSHLSVLTRMGVPALLLWAMFNFLILKRFAHVILARAHIDRKLFALALWLFVLYVILMVDISVEPGLEFSQSAIPFYFFMGFALGTIRFQVMLLPNPFRQAPIRAAS
jgi:hypothetical protein